MADRRADMCEQFSNAALGLVGELGEFVRRPSTDELGDCYYYAVTVNRMLKERNELACIETHSTPWSAREHPDYVEATRAGEYAKERKHNVIVDWPDKDTLHRWYWDEGLTQKKIAARYDYQVFALVDGRRESARWFPVEVS